MAISYRAPIAASAVALALAATAGPVDAVQAGSAPSQQASSRSLHQGAFEDALSAMFRPLYSQYASHDRMSGGCGDMMEEGTAAVD
jgi:hypothetical protein